MIFSQVPKLKKTAPKFFVSMLTPRNFGGRYRKRLNTYVQGLRNGFHLGVAHSNADFEKVDFQKNI